MFRSFILLTVFLSSLSAQTFEVASVKPHAAKDPCVTATLLPGGRFVAGCWPLQTLLREAYDVLPDQISGGPAWINSDAWDINAKAEGIAGEIPPEAFRSMLQTLIKERFRVVLRDETKLRSGFLLVVASTGHKLTPSKDDSFEFEVQPGPTLVCKGLTMPKFAAWPKGYTGAASVVVDKTGLSGKYDFTLKWSAQTLGGSLEHQPVSDNNGPSIFNSLQEQLGLRLKSEKVPTRVLVIESAERPSEN
jgi:uncharacterized protein (TIGR03435 family)